MSKRVSLLMFFAVVFASVLAFAISNVTVLKQAYAANVIEDDMTRFLDTAARDICVNGSPESGLGGDDWNINEPAGVTLDDFILGVKNEGQGAGKVDVMYFMGFRCMPWSLGDNLSFVNYIVDNISFDEGSLTLTTQIRRFEFSGSVSQNGSLYNYYPYADSATKDKCLNDQTWNSDKVQCDIINGVVRVGFYLEAGQSYGDALEGTANGFMTNTTHFSVNPDDSLYIASQEGIGPFDPSRAEFIPQATNPAFVSQISDSATGITVTDPFLAIPRNSCLDVVPITDKTNQDFADFDRNSEGYLDRLWDISIVNCNNRAIQYEPDHALKIAIPNALRDKTTNFKAYHRHFVNHNHAEPENVEEIASVERDTVNPTMLIFETERFSQFGIAYDRVWSDTDTTPPSANPTNGFANEGIAETGIDLQLFMLALFVMLCGAVALRRRSSVYMY